MNTQKKYSIMLVDDHVVLRDALVKLVGSFPAFQVTDTADNGQVLVDKLRTVKPPDIVLLDISMPQMDGYATSEWLQQNHPGVKIVTLTMFDSELPLIRLLQVGVKGFLKKDIHPRELEQALIAVAEGGFYYSHDITGKLAAVFQKSFQTNSPLEKGMVSPLEIDFLKLVATDMTYKQIAHTLKLSPSTVDNYREALFEKLNVKSRVGLAIYAVKNGIVTF